MLCTSFLRVCKLPIQQFFFFFSRSLSRACAHNWIFFQAASSVFCCGSVLLYQGMSRASEKKRKSKCFTKKKNQHYWSLLGRGDRTATAAAQHKRRKEKLVLREKSTKHSNSFTIITIFSIIRNFCSSRCERMGQAKTFFWRSLFAMASWHKWKSCREVFLLIEEKYLKKKNKWKSNKRIKVDRKGKFIEFFNFQLKWVWCHNKKKEKKQNPQNSEFLDIPWIYCMKIKI